MRYLRNRNSINRTAKYHAWIVTRCTFEELIAQMIADEAIRKARDSSRNRLSANPNEKGARDDDHHVPLTSYVELVADRLTCARDAAIHRRIAAATTMMGPRWTGENSKFSAVDDANGRERSSIHHIY